MFARHRITEAKARVLIEQLTKTLEHLNAGEPRAEAEVRPVPVREMRVLRAIHLKFRRLRE